MIYQSTKIPRLFVVPDLAWNPKKLKHARIQCFLPFSMDGTIICSHRDSNRCNEPDGAFIPCLLQPWWIFNQCLQPDGLATLSTSLRISKRSAKFVPTTQQFQFKSSCFMYLVLNLVLNSF